MKLRYCGISVCKNNSKTRPDLNFSYLPSKEKLWKKWSTFSPASWQEVLAYRDLHICSQHLDTKDIVKTLCRIRKGSKRGVSNDIQPTRGPSEREEWHLKEESDESGLKFPAKSPRVSSDVALKDRDCIFTCKDNKVSSSPTEKNIKTVKKVCFCFLPNGHWSTRNGRAC